MSINFKHPKYILPLIALPFLCLFFYVYHSGLAKKKTETKHEAGINGTVADVSGDIKKKQLSDKLDAYRNAYKDADGFTAVSPLPQEKSGNANYNNAYTDRQKQMLDSINRAIKNKYGVAGAQPNPEVPYHPKNARVSSDDKAMAEALKGLSNRQTLSQNNSTPQKDRNPMEMFKQQMAYMDSINKANDPAYKAEKQNKEAIAKAEALQAKEITLEVHKADGAAADFNTVVPEQKDGFIKVVIDENVTAYAGSRIRLKLLDDINAGKNLVLKGTYLYALISGFSGQRVTLSIKSILSNGKLLPVKLEIYDLDGLAGLYVPESAFRDFTKDLGTNTVQGVTISGSGTGSAASQFMISTVDKVFESASSAISNIIRKNKAKIKYNSYLYLIDTQALQNAQNGEALLSAGKKQ